jgi:hypothetical protein
MVQNAGRVTCPQCGANNFDSVATCFRCGASLAGGAGSRPSVPANKMGPERGMTSSSPPMNAPMMPANMNTPMMPPPVYASGGGDPNLARRSAIWLAISIPWIGIPVGWIFMMMEDQKRQAIGRLCFNWSLIALVFHMLLSFVFIQSLAPYMQMALGVTKSLSQGRNAGAGGMGGGMPESP